MRYKKELAGIRSLIDKQQDLIDRLTDKNEALEKKVETLEEGVRIVVEREKEKSKPQPYFVDPIFREYMEGEDSSAAKTTAPQGENA